MIVATLALFVATGGTGYAVSKLPKGSVGSAQIRKNAVRSQHIRAGSITTSKLAGSTLSALRAPAVAPAGVQGPVTAAGTPDRVAYADKAGFADKAGLAEKATDADKAALATNATNATSATNAANANHATTADNAGALGGKTAANFLTADTVRYIEPFTISSGQTKDMLIVGPFTLTARCIGNRANPGSGLPEEVADIIITTTEAKSSFDGDDLLGSLDPGDNIEDRQFTSTSGPPGSARMEASSDGVALDGDGDVRIKGSYLFAGINIAGQMNKCKFGGYIFL